MATFTDAWIAAYEAVEAKELKRQGNQLWNDWVAEWSDAAGQTPFGFYVDVYDVMSDYMIFAHTNGFDFSLTNDLLSEAISALAEGNDPYDIQMRIDEKTAVYVDEGHIVIGKLVITGTR
jgi:hypothetical protein